MPISSANLTRQPKANIPKIVVRNERPCQQLIAHVRRATAGEPRLANTHQFDRVIDGRRHAFAHNGELSGIFERNDVKALREQAIGDTDSELAFLLLLDRLARRGGDDLVSRFDIFSTFAAGMRELGSANFLFFDGRHLSVHADRRRFETEDGLTELREPGLNLRSFAG